jgi:DNA-binding NtrC family response regulator
MASSTKFDSSWTGSLLKGARVLVVEDDFLILMELETILSEAGAEIAGCRTVEDALALAAKNGLAAAVLDIRLGRETIAPVARELARRGIPFVFYTGQIDTDAMRAEWPDCIIVPKPAQARTIVTAVADLLHH